METCSSQWNQLKRIRNATVSGLVVLVLASSPFIYVHFGDLLSTFGHLPRFCRGTAVSRRASAILALPKSGERQARVVIATAPMLIQYGGVGVAVVTNIFGFERSNDLAEQIAQFKVVMR